MRTVLMVFSVLAGLVLVVSLMCAGLGLGDVSDITPTPPPLPQAVPMPPAVTATFALTATPTATPTLDRSVGALFNERNK